ncbi:Flagellar motor switch protein FliG [Pseudosulfitobacter sp. DSM 107133]|nr:Flagellar motor switch protein FliG [Pseudosulfitobacter sp. DSM 107133]
MNDLILSSPLPGLPDLGAPAPGAPVQLSRRAKAAVVVRLLLNEGAEIPLEDLPEELQSHLTKAMGQMRTVDRDTLSAVVSEFAQEVERIGLRFPGGIAGALNALEGKISPQTAERLRKEAGVRQTGNPWARICEIGAEKLLPILQSESIEISAVMLSKLDVKKAAALLSMLPGPRARQITYAVSLTGAVTPDAVERIGLSLAMQLSAQPVGAFDSGPVERVGAILNSSTSVTRDDVLEGLDETDQGFANAVRKAIFTFGNIPKRIAPRDIPRVLREVDPADLLIAMAGAEAAGMEASAEFILENMSGRMAASLREEMQEIAPPKPADHDTATSNMVAAIRELEAAGELILMSDDEE